MKSNAFAESFFRTLKVEEVYLWEYDTFDDAKRSIAHFIDTVYVKKRLHSSLGYRTPAECEEAWRLQTAVPVGNYGIGKTCVLGVS